MNAATLSTRWSACPFDKDAKRHVMVQIEPGPAIGAGASMGGDTRQLPALRIHVVDLTRGVWSETFGSDGLDKRRQECTPFLDLDHTDLVNELFAATADLIVKRNFGALSFSWRFSVRPLPYNDAFQLVCNALLMPLLYLAQVYEHRLAHADNVIKRQEVNIERLLALVPNPATYHAKLVRMSDESQLPVFALSNTLFASRYWHQATVHLRPYESRRGRGGVVPPTSSSQAAPAGDAYASYFASSTANSFSQALAGTARVTAAPSRPAAPRPLAPTASSQLAAPSSQLAAPPASNSQVYGMSSHSQTNGTSQFNDASRHSLFALFNNPSDGSTTPLARKPAELNLDLPSSPMTAVPPALPHLSSLGSSAPTGSRYHVGPEPPSDPATSVPAPLPQPRAPAPLKAGFNIPGVAKIGGSSSSSSSSSSSAAPPTAAVGAMPPPPPLRSAPVPDKSDEEPVRKKQKRKALFRRV
ncbi:hypothetical protein AMAG_00690 [Allomyces macrogynus ATCC 38327]|uniref:Uncharacterized protein n=1 Tax=Allomyces macrogynus (strain ATCC 38327) TaxID=578462 RepID=A0A0L0RX63_ALLM3|nr:hypothetical protein AMAG_00690 [Allomyces macrogynus ATCC 38327]|eukprot:KNE54730.1 hypothetical protein AMAG_00690 [Allomyces macrogynus ATCC 38327]